ncbi:racM [Acrasis kona]
MMLFSIDKKEELMYIKNELMTQLKTKITNNPAFFIVATKSDETDRIPEEVISKTFADDGVKFFEISSRFNEGVQELFNEALAIKFGAPVRVVQQKNERASSKTCKQQ